ncbi:hypothetical protein CASFOL_022590 [Castilleja foliolosa]|uniref:Sugar transporter SWEET1 n=1 Tax=Castilleja foliolosa TaxID=1961234 RepID=A0ABD3CVW4_9LAMI
MAIPQYSVVTLGILGTISSILVYLSPLPTFYGIVKRKSSVGFKVVPYSVALFSATLYLYYGLIEKAIILITSNSFGLLMQSIYIIIYMLYAQQQSKVFTAKVILLFNLLTMGIVIGTTYFFM